jgi:competence protein ComEC
MPLFWLALALAGGIVTSTLIPWSWKVWAFLLVLVTAVPLFLRHLFLPAFLRRSIHWYTHEFGSSMLAPVAVLAVFFLGCMRSAIAQPHFGPGDLAYYNGTGFSRLVGSIDRPPSNRPGSPIRVKAQEIEFSSSKVTIPVKGYLLVQSSGSGAWQYGDLIQVESSIEDPPESADFSYRDYLARQGVFSWTSYARLTLLSTNQGKPITAALYRFRKLALDTIVRLFPAPESALLSGILIGDDSSLPDTLYQDFKTTGTAHIIAISGFNMAILVGMLAALFSRLLGKRWGALAALTGMIIYTLMVGPEASVIRASVMAGLALAAAQIGRRQIGLNTLGLAVLSMVMINPAWLWDVGFQLSFSATLGLIVFAEPLQAACERLAVRVFRAQLPQRVSDLLAEYLLFTFAAQIVTWPVQAYHFRHLSPLSLLSNILILPAQPAVMVLGGIATLAGMAWLPLGQIISITAWPFVAYTIRAVEALAQVPGMVLSTGPMGLSVVILYYLVLALALQFRNIIITHWKQALSTITVLLVGSLSLIFWQTVFAQSDPRLRLIFLGGQSQQAAIIQAPGGSTLIINGGSSAPLLLQALNSRQGFFSHRLDALLLSRGSSKALGALPEALESLKPGLVLLAVEDLGSSAAASSVRDSLTGQGLNTQRFQPGSALNLGSGIRLHSIGETGKEPAALILEWGNFHALFPNQDLENLSPNLSHPSVLVVDNTILKEHSFEDWQQALQPQTMIISENNDLIPNWIVDLSRYRWVQVSTDGQKMWLEGK